MIPLNRLLFNDQLKQVLIVLIEGKPVRILRHIAKCGRSQVVWIYLQCGISRRATFISRQELNLAFFRWLNRQDITNTRSDYKKRISWVIWHFLKPGDLVFHQCRSEAGTVVSKYKDRQHLPWIKVDWGKGLCQEQPCYLESF